MRHLLAFIFSCLLGAGHHGTGTAETPGTTGTTETTETPGTTSTETPGTSTETPGTSTETPGTEPRSAERASRCRRETDGLLWRVDCVDLGLRDVPSDLSAFTSYLDLSMNNLSALPANALSHLHLLQELRLAGNALTQVPRDVFAGLLNLRVLMLQNNRLRQVPSDALQNLRKLQSLRLDANLIASLPATSFAGLVSLRHLWLDDNALTQVPVCALAGLPALQAVTLALNRITSIPDKAFDKLHQLVVLDLHNNQIRHLGRRCFDSLHSLETLDLNGNRLSVFPVGIRALPRLRDINLHSNSIRSIPEYAFIGNPSLETINVHKNPLQVVGRSAFQQLPALQALSLNGAADITVFPDLTGTNRLETLTITGASISSVPSAICEKLPNLQTLDLSHNLIQRIPSLRACRKIQRIDLSFNRLSSFALEGLQSLTHLRLAGNVELRETLPLHRLPRLRVAEMPFAFQCCVFVTLCDESTCPDRRTPGSVDNISKHSQAQLETYFVTTRVDDAQEDLVVELGVEPRPQPAVHCYPIPGPGQTQLCQSMLDSWLVHFSAWLIFLLSVVFNSLALVSVFLSSASESPVHRLLGAVFWVHLFTGLSTITLAAADAQKAAGGRHCSVFHPWERDASPRVTDFLFTLSSEVRLFLTGALVFECRRPVRDAGRPRAKEGVGVSAVCCTLVLAIAALPVLILGEDGLSSQCVAFSKRHSLCLGYNAALVVINFLCYLLMTGTHVVPRRHKGKEVLKPRGHCTVTLLLLTNCLVGLSVALLSLSSLFRLPSLHGPEATRAVTLLLVALPACLDPLLYLVLSAHFKELCGFLRSTLFRL